MSEVVETPVTAGEPAAEQRQSIREYIESRRSPAKTPAPVSETGTPETEEQAAAKEAAAKEEKGKGGGFQRKIDKLTKKAAQLEEALEAERLAKQTLEARLVGKHTGEADKSLRPKPKEDELDANGKPKYASFNEFVDDLTDWKLEKARLEQKQSSTKESQDAELKAIFDSHQARVLEAKKQFPDWDEVFEEIQEDDVPIPQAAYFAIMELENGPHIAYHLVKNPDLREKLIGLKSDVAQIAEIGRISASLAAEKVKKPEPSPKPAPVSAAPAPIEPVTGSQAKSAKPLGEMRMREYIAARKSGRNT